MTAEIDLTGSWSGIFNYPGDQFPPTSFTVQLRDNNGGLAGETSELATYVGSKGRRLFGFITGQRCGSSVYFVKAYDNDHDDHIHYSGSLADGSNEIVGHWDIPGIWSGTFIMIRRSAKVEASRRTVIEEVKA